MLDTKIVHAEAPTDTAEQKELAPLRAPQRSQNKFRGWLIAFYVTLALRIWFGILGAYALLVPNKSVPEPLHLYWGLPAPPQTGYWLLLTPWERWDAIWYLRVATFGYVPNDPSPSFFPLFPILMRAIGALLGDNFMLGGIIVSTLATFFIFGLLYSLAAIWANELVATRAVLYWAIFPTSFYLLGGYAEPVMTAFALASIYFAQRKSWWLAGICAMGATLSRPLGVINLAPLVILAWQRGTNLRERIGALFLSTISITLAFSAWMLYLQITFNNALLWTHSQNFWDRILVFPWDTVNLTAQFILKGQVRLENNLFDLALTLLTLGAIILCIRKLPFAYTAYALLMLIAPLTSYAIKDEFWVAMPLAAAGRRALVVFPVFMALGWLLRWKWLQAIWIPISLAAQAIAFILFAQWVWVD